MKKNMIIEGQFNLFDMLVEDVENSKNIDFSLDTKLSDDEKIKAKEEIIVEEESNIVLEESMTNKDIYYYSKESNEIEKLERNIHSKPSVSNLLDTLELPTLDNAISNCLFEDIVNKYKDTCVRIVECYNGLLLVETQEKSIYFNSNGIKEFESKKSNAIMPMDKILVCNKDIELTDIQIKRLSEIHYGKYIKRRGDANIILLLDKNTVVINPLGWVLEYSQSALFDKSEVYFNENYIGDTNLSDTYDTNDTEDELALLESMWSDMCEKDGIMNNGNFTIYSCNNENNIENNSIIENVADTKEMNICNSHEDLYFNVGDIVEFEYGDETFTGDISRVYNNGETVNIVWDNRSTAFYYKNVRLIKKAA